MTQAERMLQIALENGDEKMTMIAFERIHFIESPVTFYKAKLFPIVYSGLEKITDNCFCSYMSANNARGVRSILMITNSLNSYKRKLISNANGYLLEKITREVFSETRISDEVIDEILMEIPTCFIINSICLICEQWMENKNYTEYEACTLQERIDRLFSKRPKILNKKLLKYLEYFSGSFQNKLLCLNCQEK